MKSAGPWEIDKTHSVNCLDALRSISDDTFDLVVTSPPYWGQRGAFDLGAEADPRCYISELVTVLGEAMRCLKSSGVLFLNLGDAYNTPINWSASDHVYSSLGKNGNGLDEENSAYTKNRGKRRAFIDREIAWLQYGNLLAIPYRIVLGMAEKGYLFRGEIIWHKSRPLPEGRCRRPHRHHESIYCFAKNERHRFRVRPPVPSIWKLRQTPNRTKHCSTFPLDLPVHCIEAADMDPGSLVLDPFMGSGTTGEAALIKGHHFVGFEINPMMCRLANDRLSRALAIQQEFHEFVRL